MRRKAGSSHKEVENEVFRRFCAVASLEIVPHTLRQPMPPEPDVVVSLDGIGFVGFELVEISPESEILRQRVLVSTSEALIEYSCTLADADQRAFDEKFRNATIHVSLVGSRGSKDLAAAAPRIFSALQSLPTGYEGSFAESGIPLPPNVISLCVTRDPWMRGPLFQAIGIGWSRPLNIDALRRKLDKQYAGPKPIHLLAWIGAKHLCHDDDAEALVQLVEKRLDDSAFNCLWVYELDTNGIAQFRKR